MSKDSKPTPILGLSISNLDQNLSSNQYTSLFGLNKEDRLEYEEFLNNPNEDDDFNSDVLLDELEDQFVLSSDNFDIAQDLYQWGNYSDEEGERGNIVYETNFHGLLNQNNSQLNEKGSENQIETEKKREKGKENKKENEKKTEEEEEEEKEKEKEIVKKKDTERNNEKDFEEESEKETEMENKKKHQITKSNKKQETRNKSGANKTNLSYQKLEEEFDLLYKYHLQLLMQNCIIAKKRNEQKLFQENVALLWEIIEHRNTSLVHLKLTNNYGNSPSETALDTPLLRRIPKFIAKIDDLEQVSLKELKELFDSLLGKNTEKKLIPKKLQVVCQKEIGKTSNFTLSEEYLLICGMRKYGKDWRKIRDRYLPTKLIKNIQNRVKYVTYSKSMENNIIRKYLDEQSSKFSEKEIKLLKKGKKEFSNNQYSNWKMISKKVFPNKNPHTLKKKWNEINSSSKKERTINQKILNIKSPSNVNSNSSNNNYQKKKRLFKRKRKFIQIGPRITNHIPKNIFLGSKMNQDKTLKKKKLIHTNNINAQNVMKFEKKEIKKILSFNDSIFEKETLSDDSDDEN
ncbi:DNAj [Anaeramoeba flamelloides]|uniref:DNAj n=1 Tax=Anaeramoeba flamelloides TaxID=1746091 RepID=A0ABQ8Z3I5_9EUKA|nr:DNAj [Anaeramoeba flamelloides]